MSADQLRAHRDSDKIPVYHPAWVPFLANPGIAPPMLAACLPACRPALPLLAPVTKPAATPVAARTALGPLGQERWHGRASLV